MKQIIILLVSFMSFALQSKNINEITVVDSSIVVNSNKEYIIAEIKIKGLISNNEQNLSKEILWPLVGEKIDIQGKKIVSMFKSFFKQGLFSYGKIFVTKQKKDSVWLEIVLKPTPIISTINFVGITKNEQEELQSTISILNGSYLRTDMIIQTMNQIKSFFKKKGFDRVKVKIQQINDITNKNQVALNILIKKNQKIKVKRIHIIGNNVFSNSTLKKMIKNTTEKSSLLKNPKNFLQKIFSSNKFVEKELDKDIKNIVLKYNEKGYTDANITSKIVPVKDNLVDIYLKIDEGKKYFIRSINWVGNTFFSSENLNSILNMKLGDVYNNKKLSERLLEDDDAISNLYYNNGYIFSSINPIEMCIKNDSVDIEIYIYEGIQARINHVTINGNNKIYENIIRRELSTKPGQLFNKNLLIRSAQNIANMGHFDKKKIKIQPVTNVETGEVNINYDLTSKEEDKIEASIGLRDRRLIGNLCLKFSNFSLKNLFCIKNYSGIIPHGEGQTLTLEAQNNGNCYQSYGISFLEPWFGGKYPNSLLLNTNYVIQLDSSKNSNDYIKIFNISSNYKKQLNWPDKYFTFIPSISYQHYWLPNNCSNFPIDITNNLTLGLTLCRNSTNNSVYTSNGSIFSLSFNATCPHSIFRDTEYYSDFPQKKSSMAKYYKLKFKNKLFIPLNNGIKAKRIPVLMNHIEYGLIMSYNKKKYKPFETFGMGGNGMTSHYTTHDREIVSLRGYEFGVFPQKGDGHLYTKIALELRYPLIIDQSSTIYGLTFAEYGNVWGSAQSFSLLDLKHSVGIGIRILLPMIGLIGFDWAYGFDRVNNEKKHETNISGFQFHFVLGQES
jgi:outer membrane protein insertion porin family